MTRRILTAMLAIVMLMSAAACAETRRTGKDRDGWKSPV